MNFVGMSQHLPMAESGCRSYWRGKLFGLIDCWMLPEQWDRQLRQLLKCRGTFMSVRIREHKPWISDRSAGAIVNIFGVPSNTDSCTLTVDRIHWSEGIDERIKWCENTWIRRGIKMRRCWIGDMNWSKLLLTALTIAVQCWHNLDPNEEHSDSWSLICISNEHIRNEIIRRWIPELIQWARLCISEFGWNMVQFVQPDKNTPMR